MVPPHLFKWRLVGDLWRQCVIHAVVQTKSGNLAHRWQPLKILLIFTKFVGCKKVTAALVLFCNPFWHIFNWKLNWSQYFYCFTCSSVLYFNICFFWRQHVSNKLGQTGNVVERSKNACLERCTGEAVHIEQVVHEKAHLTGLNFKTSSWEDTGGFREPLRPITLNIKQRYCRFCSVLLL